jgi:hypothetical protein
MVDKRKEFENFLKGVDLNKYRKIYQSIKIVEMDLPKYIQAIKLIYDIYWDKKDFISFDDFYNMYAKEKEVDLEIFRKDVRLCKNCFYLGLPARIYRTWASIITQIQGGYVAESVFGKGTVSMSEELDRAGADIQVNYKGYILNYQVKKESYSREVRQRKEVKKPIAGEFIDLYYTVPSRDIFETPKKRDGDYKIGYLRFKEDKRLYRLDNGFVIFTAETFLPKKREIDSKVS